MPLKRHSYAMDGLVPPVDPVRLSAHQAIHETCPSAGQETVESVTHSAAKDTVDQPRVRDVYFQLVARSVVWSSLLLA